MIVASIVNSFAAWPQEDILPFLKRPSYQNMVASAAIRTLRTQHRTDAVPAILDALKAGGFSARELGAALTTVGALTRGTKRCQAGSMIMTRGSIWASGLREAGRLCGSIFLISGLARSISATRSMAWMMEERQPSLNGCR